VTRGALFAFATAVLYAQDPFRVSPENYKLEFENKFVRVSRVRYRPGDKLPVHDHPALPTIYIYTTDGGPIIFGHQEFAAIRRPAVKAGQIRFNRGNKETHTTEYLGDAPSEYVRVEIKLDPLEKPRRDIRIAADDSTPFENAQLRIERADCSPCSLLADPAVIVTMADGRVCWIAGAPPPAGRQIRVVLKNARDTI
jgi:hypothetical protein